MNKNLMIGVVVVLVVLGAGWYFLKNQSAPVVQEQEIEETLLPSGMEDESENKITESTDSSTMEGVKEFTVTGSPFKFDIPIIKVKKGDTVKITFKNAQGFHDFVIDEFNVAAKQANGPSEEVVTFVAGKTGEFAYYCSVGQHRANGMEGKLVVE